ncbi:MAG TPA: hypothetical protein VE440_02600 [Gaiellaceae bacterium]|nr:hypothetical protein [Gaiellaceae bacterium]
MNGCVRTVLGDVEPSAIGPTYCHEHLMTRPAARLATIFACTTAPKS